MYDPDASHIPVTRGETEYARHRRPIKTPVPRPGDRVLYRHDEHGDVTDALVLEVQDLEDRRAPDLWHVVEGSNGLSVVDALGRPIYRRCPDPWPWLRIATAYGVTTTWEARVRGSCGWLPAGWDSPLFATSLLQVR